MLIFQSIDNLSCENILDCDYPILMGSNHKIWFASKIANFLASREKSVNKYTFMNNPITPSEKTVLVKVYVDISVNFYKY